MHVPSRKESELTEEDAANKSTAEAFEIWRLISSESKQSTKYLTQCNLKSPLKTEGRWELEPKCGKGK